MKKPKLIISALLLSAGLVSACVHHEPRSAQYDPPTVSFTVADEEHIEQADRDARKFCRSYDKKAERLDLTPGTQGISVSYQCR